MEVYKLHMCRICLVEDVRMYVFANTILQEVYEKLTDIPLVTEDNRPMLACYFCCAKLKQCWRFKRKCLKAEELFTQMMNENYEVKPQIGPDLLGSSEYVMTPTYTISFVDGITTESNVVKEESAAKSEEQDGEQTDSDHENKDETMLPIEISPQRSKSGDTPPHHTDSDSEDDLPLKEIKIEVEEEKFWKKLGSAEKTSTPGAKDKKLEDSVKTLENNTEEVIESIQNLISEEVKFKKPTTTINSINVTNNENNSRKKINHCFYCKLNFRTSLDLMQHMRKHTIDKKFKCKICQRSFEKEINLKSHLRSHSHKILSDIDQITNGKNKFLNQPLNTSKKRYQCDYCKGSFKLKDDLRNHIKIKHTNKEPHKCKICQTSFSKRGDYVKHYRTHNGGKSYKCEFCGQFFGHMSGLKRHIILHTGEKPHRCDKCGLSFNRNDHLKKHLCTHEPEKRFQCDYCGKFHLNKASLKYHIETHTGEKHFKCEICERKFRYPISKSHLERCSDQKSIKVPTGAKTTVKAFKCDVCSRSYATASILKFHIKSHAIEKPYKCEVCGRSFNYAHHLKDHSLTHTGERPHKCEICHKGFNKASYLKVHMRLHTGEKPYKCDVCLRYFTRPDNLRQHMRTHTGEGPIRRVKRSHESAFE